MKYKLSPPLPPPAPFAPLETIIGITRVMAADPAATRAREFIRWVDSLGHTPTDAEFEAWCKRKGVQMRGGRG